MNVATAVRVTLLREINARGAPVPQYMADPVLLFNALTQEHRQRQVNERLGPKPNRRTRRALIAQRPAARES